MDASQTTYSPEEIILSNLEELSERRNRISEQEIAHLRELAVEIAAGFDDAATFLASLSDHRLPHNAERKGQTGADEPFPTELRVRLCAELRKQLPTPPAMWQEFFFPVSELPDPSAFHRVTYQRSRWTDAAFLRFSDVINEARAFYAHNFRSVCEDVYNGISEYCILPIENETDGLLHSFHRLAETYDLKIAAVCAVNAGQESRGTRFALLARQVYPLQRMRNAPLLFTFSATLSGAPDADDLLRAARLCGLSPLRSETFPGENGVQNFRADLSIGKGDLPSFLLYLSMEVPHYHPIGLYTDLP